MKIKLWMGGAALFQLAAAQQVPVKADPAKPVAPVAAKPAALAPADISANREAWISSWSDLLEG